MAKINTFWKLRVSNNFLTNYTKYAFHKNEVMHFGRYINLKLTVINGNAYESFQ